MQRLTSLAALVAALVAALATSLAAPAVAQADRCNPDEMIGPAYTLVTGKPYKPVFGEDDGPFCYAMKTVVYPAVGCDPAVQSLVQCAQAQPARAAAIASGVCYEAYGELYDAYYAMPYTVQRSLRFAMDFISKATSCG